MVRGLFVPQHKQPTLSAAYLANRIDIIILCTSVIGQYLPRRKPFPERQVLLSQGSPNGGSSLSHHGKSTRGKHPIYLILMYKY